VAGATTVWSRASDSPRPASVAQPVVTQTSTTTAAVRIDLADQLGTAAGYLQVDPERGRPTVAPHGCQAGQDGGTHPRETLSTITPCDQEENGCPLTRAPTRRCLTW